MAKTIARCIATAAMLFETPWAEDQCSLGVCTEEPSDCASAMQKRSQVVASQDRMTNVAMITEETLSEKGGKSSSGGGNVEKSTNSKGSSSGSSQRRRRRTTKTVTLEEHAERLEKNLADLMEKAVVAHQRVQDAFTAKVVNGADALRDAALAADRAMLAAHVELVVILDKLDKQWEDKVYTLAIAAGEAQQKVSDATNDAREKLEQKAEEAKAAWVKAELKWEQWQDKYKNVQTKLKTQLDEFVTLLQDRAEIVKAKYAALLTAAADAAEAAGAKLEDAVDAALDEATQKLVDAAVEAEERRVEMMTHYKHVVLDLQKKVDQLQARFEDIDQKRREVQARAEIWAQKFRESADDTAAKVREAQNDFIFLMQARMSRVRESADEVKTYLDNWLRDKVQEIDNQVQNTIAAAVKLIQNQFDIFADRLKAARDALKQTVTAELEKREKEMKAAVIKVEATLKEAITDLETLVVAKVEAKVAEAEAALREAKANADAAVESVKKAAEDAKENLQRVADGLRTVETQLKQQKDAIVVSLQKAKSDAKEIEAELKKVVSDAVDSAVESANKAVLAVTKLFNAFR